MLRGRRLLTLWNQTTAAAGAHNQICSTFAAPKGPQGVSHIRTAGPSLFVLKTSLHTHHGQSRTRAFNTSCRELKMLLDETPMFEASLLQEIDWSNNTVNFSPPISPSSPGEGLVMRPLCMADFNKGFFKVLSQLTKTGDVTPEQFIKKFEHMKNTGDYYVLVVEDTNLGQIVATATLIREHKFIHSCTQRGRVEEVVVSDFCRGKQLGKLLVATLLLLGQKLNCYKVTLECSPKNVAFYEKFGFNAPGDSYMQCRFFD